MNSNDGESLVESSDGIDWLGRQIKDVAPHPVVEKNPITFVVAFLGLLLGLVVYWIIGTPIADTVDKLSVFVSLLTNVWNSVVPPEVQSLLQSYPNLRLFTAFIVVILAVRVHNQGVEHLVLQDITPRLRRAVNKGGQLISAGASKLILAASRAVSAIVRSDFVANVVAGVVSSLSVKIFLAIIGGIGFLITIFTNFP